MNEDKIDKIEESLEKVQEQVKNYSKLESDVQMLLLDRESKTRTPNILFGQQERDSLSDLNSERVLEVIWDDFLYTIPTFAPIERYTRVTTLGSVVMDDTGLVCTTGASSGDSSVGYLGVDDSVITRTRETRFRAITKVSSTSSIDCGVGTLGTLANNSTGFQFLNGTLYARCDDGSTETSISVGSYTADTFYDLQIFFYPNTGVKFFVDGIEKTTITTNFPVGTGALARKLIYAYAGTTAAAAKSLTVSLAEFLQRKK